MQAVNNAHCSMLKALETLGFATKNATVLAVALLRLWSRGELAFNVR
ncbi:hypothetical protein HMPREF9435_1030 [Gardnerella vaginalis 315-A]|nr:hypothetical protein HMPREF9435_1030 [Gardnerella vaginalis 315-A]